MDISFVSATILLLLVIDPFGNIPVFIAALANTESTRRFGIVMRECGIAYLVLLFFMFFGVWFMRLLQLTDAALGIAGGVILFLIALRMIFRHPEGIFGDRIGGEPFIVPLAVPSVAGPSALATVLLLVSKQPSQVIEWVGALTLAIGISAVVLVLGERISKLVGERGILAFQRLMGLILTALAIQMLLHGVETFVRHLHKAF
ncbi:MAG TPA: MarC family protein [Burkholderiales bacterium]|nr:MarC family protein [Burkholderiales bacterium]